MSEDVVEKYAEMFKALGDKTRLSIVRKLFTREHCVTDLARALRMDAPRVSFHLTRLKYVGLVVDERQGQRVAYRMNPAVCKTDNKGETEIRMGGCKVTFGSNAR